MTQKIKGNPALTTVRAIITTRWGNRGYIPHIVKTVETYYVDTALDNDSDAWNIEIGDPNGDMLDMLRRDSEVRVQLYGYSPKGAEPIVTGMADSLSFTEQGTWSITGRDLSALAVDSTIPAQFFRQAKAYSLVRRQALQLGFHNTNLATGLGGQTIVKKAQQTDGSESYWEFWYRLYRKERMWLWTEPDGTLVGANLNYSGPPFYYFGRPRSSDSKQVKQQHLPIEHLSMQKATQNRFEEVWVYWHHGDNGKITKQKDISMRDWIKKPLKITSDTDARSVASARKTAFDEIHDGMVGELEYTLTVPDPGFEIHQNRIARMRVPELNIDTDMFVVGVKRSGDTNGVMLEVRLRERHYAITSRVPKDPQIPKTTPGKPGTTGLGNDLPGIAGISKEWGDAFVASAKKHHGSWDFNFYLAVLLGICQQETGFTNERRLGGPGGNPPGGYYLWEQVGTKGGSEHAPPTNVDAHGRSLEEWRTLFANEPKEQNGSSYVSESYAVGPMQLLSMKYKLYADGLQKTHYHDQWLGGRWNPVYNIDGGGYALADKLSAIGADPSNDSNIWQGVGDYGEGAAYAQSVKYKVLIDPGYLKLVQDSRAQAIIDGKQTQDPGGDPGAGTGPFPFNNSPADLKTLTHLALLDSSVDIAHVNWTLLSRLNAWAKAGSKVITIWSGYRSKAEQQALWDGAPGNGLIRNVTVADPAKGSNHMIGEACDCYVGGVAMGLLWDIGMAKYKIHPSVYIQPSTKGYDPPHMARIEVWG